MSRRALAEPLLVRAEDQRHVREPRGRGAERLVQQHLLGRVRNVIVAAHDVRDRHVDVVDHDREVVGRVTIGAQHDEVLDRGVLSNTIGPRTRSLKRVSPSGTGSAPRGAAAPPRGGRSSRRRATREAGPIVVQSPACGARPLPASPAARSGRAVAVVGVPAFDRAVGHRAVARRAARTGSTGACGPPTSGPSSQSRPSQRRPSRIPRPSPRTSARRRCPRCAARTCRRAGARRAS